MNFPNYGATGQPPPPYAVEGVPAPSAHDTRRIRRTVPSAQSFFTEYPQLPPPNARPQPNTYQVAGIPSSSSLADKDLKRGGFMESKMLTIALTFMIALTFCCNIMPITYCNDPADPEVRERTRREWYKESKAHQEQVTEREIVKARWKWEDGEREVLYNRWQQEEKDHERELRERAQREEDERKRLNMYWAGVEAHQCTTYATRDYTATLTNVPMGYDRRLDACRLTPLSIHGVSYLPSRCEDNGPLGIIGHWRVNQHEPECTTFWREYRDKGCTSQGSRKRRIEHYLEMLPVGGDWEEFCATTPIRFHGMEFQGAQNCAQYHQGTYGYWEIDDANC